MLTDQGDEVEEESSENPTWTSFKAVLLLILGTIIAAACADPLVDAVDNFSEATSIPSFFISFIIMPFATNSSEAVSAIIFASRKKRNTASLTFSEVCRPCFCSSSPFHMNISTSYLTIWVLDCGHCCLCHCRYMAR